MEPRESLFDGLRHYLHTIIERPGMFGSPETAEGMIVQAMTDLLALRRGISPGEAAALVNKTIHDVFHDQGMDPELWTFLCQTRPRDQINVLPSRPFGDDEYPIAYNALSDRAREVSRRLDLAFLGV